MSEEKVRINMILPKEIKDFMSDEAWRQRKSITAYLIDLIKEEMKKHKGE